MPSCDRKGAQYLQGPTLSSRFLAAGFVTVSPQAWPFSSLLRCNASQSEELRQKSPFCEGDLTW